ncbi:MAG: hypothetical protein JEY79_09810 [Pseudodesulfovibrio sp.]|nr:hypothetical protein [Pseudodesulfovibrio sp.]
MTHYKQILLTAILLCILALLLPACTVTTVEYGMPYGYSTSWSPASDAGISREYQHYRPWPAPSQFRPNER